ncbi:hypothetical protein GOP47_0028850 [Adiantum capillus-veneris]|nr:hypothetical protein GOP47_0028850 [Adiantum capillus-veneris]
MENAMAQKQSTSKTNRQSTLLAMPNFTRIQTPSRKKVKVHVSNEDRHPAVGDFSSLNVVSSSTSVASESKGIKSACLAWNDAWAVSFDWVYFDASKGRMFCKICESMKKCRSEFGTCGF